MTHYLPLLVGPITAIPGVVGLLLLALVVIVVGRVLPSVAWRSCSSPWPSAPCSGGSARSDSPRSDGAVGSPARYPSEMSRYSITTTPTIVPSVAIRSWPPVWVSGMISSLMTNSIAPAAKPIA